MAAASSSSSPIKVTRKGEKKRKKSSKIGNAAPSGGGGGGGGGKKSTEAKGGGKKKAKKKRSAEEKKKEEDLAKYDAWQQLKMFQRSLSIDTNEERPADENEKKKKEKRRQNKGKKSTNTDATIVHDDENRRPGEDDKAFRLKGHERKKSSPPNQGQLTRQFSVDNVSTDLVSSDEISKKEETSSSRLMRPQSEFITRNLSFQGDEEENNVMEVEVHSQAPPDNKLRRQASVSSSEASFKSFVVKEDPMEQIDQIEIEFQTQNMTPQEIFSHLISPTISPRSMVGQLQREMELIGYESLNLDQQVPQKEDEVTSQTGFALADAAAVTEVFMHRDSGQTEIEWAEPDITLTPPTYSEEEMEHALPPYPPTSERHTPTKHLLTRPSSSESLQPLPALLPFYRKHSRSPSRSRMSTPNRPVIPPAYRPPPCPYQRPHLPPAYRDPPPYRGRRASSISSAGENLVAGTSVDLATNLMTMSMDRAATLRVGLETGGHNSRDKSFSGNSTSSSLSSSSSSGEETRV